MSGRVIARRATMWKVTRRYVLATSAVRLRDSSRFPLFDLTETTLLIRWQEDVASWCSVFNTRPCHGIVWLVILTKCPLYWSPPPPAGNRKNFAVVRLRSQGSPAKRGYTESGSEMTLWL